MYLYVGWVGSYPPHLLFSTGVYPLETAHIPPHYVSPKHPTTHYKSFSSTSESLNMISRKRKHDDRDPELIPLQTFNVPFAMPKRREGQRFLALMDTFYTIPLRDESSQNDPIQPLARSYGSHAKAILRISSTPSLTNIQRANLSAMLTVLNDNFPGDHSCHQFTASIALETTSNDELAAFAEWIEKGLVAFVSNAGCTYTNDGHTLDAAQTFNKLPLTSAAPKSSQIATKSVRSTRKRTRKPEIKGPEEEICRLCNATPCVQVNIVPSAINDNKTKDFWTFVSMFRGTTAMSCLKAAALHRDSRNPGNQMNIMTLCHKCYALNQKSLISLVPMIIESTPEFPFPYEPRRVAAYVLIVEFPGGKDGVVIDVHGASGLSRLVPGSRLTLQSIDPIDFPLPHPLLFQLHLLCNRMVILRKNAGYPITVPGGNLGDTALNPIVIDDEPTEVPELGEDRQASEDCRASDCEEFVPETRLNSVVDEDEIASEPEQGGYRLEREPEEGTAETIFEELWEKYKRRRFPGRSKSVM